VKLFSIVSFQNTLEPRLAELTLSAMLQIILEEEKEQDKIFIGFEIFPMERTAYVCLYFIG
jgi:hypothetical protein